jgi:hypothetical protein
VSGQSSDAAAILSDPIFQLNIGLWMLESLPREAPIWPMLREAGYILHSIGRAIPLPPGARVALRGLGLDDHPPSPDLLASPPSNEKWLVVECKGHGFGPESSTAKQAMKILAASVDIAAGIGLQPGAKAPGAAVYLTVSPDHDPLATTLDDLRNRLDGIGVPSAQAGTLGLIRSGVGIHVEMAGDLPLPIAQLAGRQPILALRPDEDPRPLYLIPWLPDQAQTAEMSDYCQQVFFARIRSTTVGLIGRAQAPTHLVLSMDRLLEDATFGLSLKWYERGIAQGIESACTAHLTKLLRSPMANALSVPPGRRRIDLELRSQTEINAAISALLGADMTDVPRLDQVQPEFDFDPSAPTFDGKPN